MAQKTRLSVPFEFAIDLPTRYLNRMPATALRGLPLQGTVCDLLDAMWKRELMHAMRVYEHRINGHGQRRR